MSTGRRVAGIILNTAIAFMSIHGIGLMEKKGWNMFQNYDVISNILAAAACLLCAGCFFFSAEAPGWIRCFKLTATVCQTLTLIVVAAILIPTERNYKGLLLDFGRMYLNVLCPLLSIISFLVLDRIDLKPVTGAHVAAIPTLIYGIVLLILNLTHAVYGPYQFLWVYRPESFTYLWLPGLLALTVLLGIILTWANRKFHKVPALESPASGE